jgi:HEAT repeat protein
VLVEKGKALDWKAAFDAAENDAPVETFKDLNNNGRWDVGEPFTDGNGNGVYDRDAGIRTALRDALRKHRDKPELRKWLLSHALDHPESWVRILCLDALGDMDDGPTRQAILARIGPEKDREVRLRLLDVAGKTKGGTPVATLLKLADDPDEGVRAAASAAAVDSALDDPQVRAFLLKLLASSKWPDRVQGAEAAGRGKVAEAVPALVQCLGHDRWSVRLAALEAVMAMRPREAVDGLVALMAKEGPYTRLSTKANEALFQITGMELPDDADQWKAWLASHGDFKVPEELPVHAPMAGRTVSKFYGLKLETARVVFVIDHSGSMTAVDTSGAHVKTRWEVLDEQLRKAIASLPKGAKFNVVTFSSTVDTFRPRSVDATDTERAAAAKWLDGYGPQGETNVWGGLSTGLDDPDVDTIVLLTDGEPTLGEFIRPSDIQRETLIRNRFRRIAIHTVSVGQDSKFLRELAKENGGTYARK